MRIPDRGLGRGRAFARAAEAPFGAPLCGPPLVQPDFQAYLFGGFGSSWRTVTVTVATGAVTVTVRPVTVATGAVTVTVRPVTVATGAVTVTVRPVTVTGGV